MEDDELFKQYRETGDIALRNRLVEKYLYIAAVIARKFTGRGVEYDDLYQVASLALIRGVERFDPEKGVKFSTFITPTITGEIKNYFRDRSRVIHLPRKVNELRAAIRKASDELTAETGRNPSAREIAARVGVGEEEVLRCAEAGKILSLDQPAEENGMNLYEIFAAEDDGSVEQVENRDAILTALRTLNPAERRLIELRFGEELSQTETAGRMGVSQMYVSRLEHKILEKLRENLGKGMAEG